MVLIVANPIQEGAIWRQAAGIGDSAVFIKHKGREPAFKNVPGLAFIEVFVRPIKIFSVLENDHVMICGFRVFMKTHPKIGIELLRHRLHFTQKPRGNTDGVAFAKP